MGSISELIVGEYPIYSVKNSYNSLIVNLLFQKEDFKTEKRRWAKRSKLVWGDEISKKKGTFTFKGFCQSVKVCKQRLEIHGTNLRIAKRNFNIAKKIAKAEGIYDFSISKITFEEYLAEIADIIKKRETSYEYLHTNLRDSLISGELAIFGQTYQDSLYAVLNCLTDDSIVEYDLTEVIQGGWVDNDSINFNERRILVLTEGKTDVEFITLALKKLYPHLYNYYHFIDFAEFKLESNASALVKLVRTFAATKIDHPIIALFDNDTTGIMEMNKLKSLKLPDNLKVMRLPDINFAKKYPTIGPTGIKKMNVNGLACGIEMYLGADVLEKDGVPMPIHWKSYDAREKKYQGEILDKTYVQETFRKKMDSDEIKDFSNLDLVLKMLFKAFQD